MNASSHHRQDRIVVVDDDARIRDLLRRYLSQEGFDVLLAEDGKALSRLQTRENIDLIVLDLMLPGEDGLSLCRSLRAHSALPVIMLTARGDDTDRIVGLEVGAECRGGEQRRGHRRLQRVDLGGRRRADPAAGHAQRPRGRRQLDAQPLLLGAHRDCTQRRPMRGYTT